MAIKHSYVFFALCCLMISAACTQSKPSKLFMESDVPHAQLGDNVTPQHYSLDLRVDPKSDVMNGVVKIDVAIAQMTQQIWLHSKTIDVKEAFLVQDDAVIPLSFTQVSSEDAPSGVARLNSETPIMDGDAVITLSYETAYNLALNSAYKVSRGGEDYIFTQMEPIAAREAFPSFDEPRFKVPFDVTISAPKGNEVYANTPEIASTELNDGWVQHVFATTRPLPTYLVAFGVGPFDVVDFGEIAPNAVRERPIDLRGFTAKGSGDKMQYALENTAGLLETMEEYFGTQYPYEKLDIIAALDFAYGAMENPGAIVYLEYLLLLDENAPLKQRQSYARVHAHELAHQWFGNLVTPVWWEDIWLNEAFATWMGNKSADTWQPDGGYDRVNLRSVLSAMELDSLASTRKVREPLERSENVIDQFDAITYRKGGGVLSMFESYLGEEKFRDGVRLHMERYADGVASGDDFFASIAEGSGEQNVVSAMKSFVDQEGLPLVSASLQCTPEGAAITLSQSRYAPLGSEISQGHEWEIPVCTQMGFTDGTQTKICTLLDTVSESLPLETEQCPVWIMPNAQGAGYYRFSLKQENWFSLFQNVENLSGREALAAMDSLSAAFKAGVVQPGVYIKGMEVFSASTEYDVAQAAGDELSWMESVLPKSALASLAALTNDMYAERYVNIVEGESLESDLLGPVLADRLLAYGTNPVLQAEFASKGAAYLGLSAEADKTSVPQNLLETALRSVLMLQPQAAYEPVLRLVKEGSAFEKSAAISALGALVEPDLVDNLRALALDDKEALTGRQASSVISVLMDNPETKGSTWDWLKENFEAFLTTRVADVRRAAIPSIFEGCSAADHEEAKTFFMSKSDLIPGYERSLKQALETIDLCAALFEATAETLPEALLDR